MTHVLIVSNDQRALSLVDHFQPVLLSPIVATKDINQGLKEFFDRRPPVVFIQDELSGTSAEAVVGHIRTLLREEAPQVVLLRSAGSHNRDCQHYFDGFISLSLPEQAIREKFREHLEKIPLLQWRSVAGSKEDAGVLEENTAAAQTAALKEEIAETEPPIPDFEPGQGDDEAVQGDARLSDQCSACDKVMEIDLGESFSVADVAMESCPPVKAKNYRKYGIGVSCIFVIGFALYCAVSNFSPVTLRIFAGPLVSGESLTADEARADVSAGARTSRQPAAIPWNFPDPEYVAAHPGWERYFDDRQEFLVYREKGEIKAIQVIALDEKEIAEEFCMRFLRDASGGELPIAQSSEERDGYLIEKAAAGGTSEVLVYRKKPGREIRAFVVEFL